MQFLSLRYLLFIAFTLISAVPVIFLGVWVQRTALDREFSAVEDKHLLLARNLTGALTRYVTDAETTFRVAANEMQADRPMDGLRDLLRSLSFRHVCIVSADGKVKRALVANQGSSASTYTPEIFQNLGESVAQADANPDTVVFSGVQPDANGDPAIFLIRSMGENRYALGALAMDYVVAVQQAITFGELGHAAIVDQDGRVLAHPNTQWRTEMKDISKIKPVQFMMAAQTGVTTFYSPAMKADMIAGFTSVPRVGWGVMIPQPIAELETRAEQVQLAALAVAVVGILIAIIISWWLAGLLSRPIQSVVTTSRSIADGEGTMRVPMPSSWAPAELRELTRTFNGMANEIELRDAEMRRTAEDANAASRAKSEFLANMSHELRTPLNAILGFSEVLKSEMLGSVDNASYTNYAADIHSSAQRLLEMVNDSLELSAAESGHIAPANANIDIVRLADDCMRFMRPSADARNVTLNLSVAANVPSLVSDESRLRQVLLSLLSNAIKFTPADGQVSLDIDSNSTGDLEFRVRDTGVGISAADMETAMAPFGQVGSAHVRRNQGPGLGLPLARRLIDVLGGSFRIESSPGVGTTVTLTFPKERKSAA